MCVGFLHQKGRYGNKTPRMGTLAGEKDASNDDADSQQDRDLAGLSRGRAFPCEEALARFGTYEIHVSVHVRL